MDFLFWGIMLIWAVFGAIGTIPANRATLGPYLWWPGFILFFILGLRIIPLPH
jgi:hypothetical protein